MSTTARTTSAHSTLHILIEHNIKLTRNYSIPDTWQLAWPQQFVIAYQQHVCSRGAYGGVCVCVHMCVRASGVRARVRARVCVLVCVMRAKAFQHSSFTHAHSFFTPNRPEPWPLRVATPPPLEGIDEASARPPGPRRGCAERGCPTCHCC